MKKILFIVGEFLGHWGRSLMIARSLQQDFSVEVVFAGRDPRKKLISFTKQYQFRMISLGDDFNKDLFDFSDRVEKVMQQEQADFIILDVGLIPWFTYVRFPETPSMALTQYFISPLSHENTLQRINFNNNKDEWNKNRQVRGLSILESADDLFKGHLIVLTDPKSLISHYYEVTDDYLLAGALVWEPEMPLPAELKEIRNCIYVSIGSTGIEMPFKLLKSIMELVNAENIVIAHPSPRIFSDISDPCLKKYDWLPASKILAHAKFAVTQGGAGSTYQSFQTGVPVACWPSHRNHIILAEHIERYGAGLKLKKNGWETQLELISKNYQIMKGFVKKMDVENSINSIHKIVDAIKKRI